ncbi:hypothetical protein F2P81_011132 [Scophthalmus maximus]|uniref:Uncharacterized protein n=1 Tax=Scophthalmus maximus TaxID=52904 RepID=A0A6A4SVB6_SCOMX|nr:hypothetical protein F2P81_011132 [Scophthalmus maximus]
MTDVVPTAGGDTNPPGGQTDRGYELIGSRHDDSTCSKQPAAAARGHFLINEKEEKKNLYFATTGKDELTMYSCVSQSESKSALALFSTKPHRNIGPRRHRASAARSFSHVTNINTVLLVILRKQPNKLHDDCRLYASIRTCPASPMASFKEVEAGGSVCVLGVISEDFTRPRFAVDEKR